VIDSSLRAGGLGYKFNKTGEGKLTLRIERMSRVSRESEDVKEQDAVSFSAPQSNNGMHPTRFRSDAVRQLESLRSWVRAGDAGR
jgi:hypothetical protein